MLCNLKIHNYAIINELEIDFRTGLTTITGETGAGKSILLGALSLILGKRADTAVLNDKSRKCIVEGSFDISNYGLKPFFTEHNLDYEDQSILRREISSAGKSRAFINDIPVTLDIISELALQLIDIHSQHQTLNLSNSLFQMKVIDGYTQNHNLLSEYQDQYQEYRKLLQDYDGMEQEARQSGADLDYLRFQFEQLDEASLVAGEQEELESELEMLNHAEEIKTALSEVETMLQDDAPAILPLIKECSSVISRIIKYMPGMEEIHDRIESTYIEIKDIEQEIRSVNQKIDLDPERLNVVRERLDLLYTLEKKHQVQDIDALIMLKDEFQQKIESIDNYDHDLLILKKELERKHEKLLTISSGLSERRKNALQSFEKQVTHLLKELAMPNATFQVVLEETSDLNLWGKNSIRFVFTANKNTQPQDISRVASGGELSRLMLTIKSLMSDSTGLPTIIFDEIDTGVSGEVAEKVGNILHRMAQKMQIINITHLPQIASKGNDHFLVYKTEEENFTNTKVRLLSPEERHYEIARMLSGEEITAAALENARILLKN